MFNKMKLNYNKIIIRELSPGDSLEELTALLHRSYKQLAEMNLNYLATHQDVAMTKKRTGKGTCFVIEHQSKIIGTLTYYPRHSQNHLRENWLDSPWLGQMGIDPKYQQQGLGLKLMNHAENHARSIGEQIIALDTSEQATHLLDWYKKLGYKFHDFVDWEVTNYRSIILKKRL